MILISGCANVDSQGVGGNPKNTPSPLPTVTKIMPATQEIEALTPSPIPAETHTAIPPTIVPNQTTTPTLFTPIQDDATQKQVILNVCPLLGEYKPGETELNGNLVVFNSPQESFLFDLAKGEKKNIPLYGELLHSFQVSIDGNFLLYSEKNSDGYKQYIRNGDLDVIWSTQVNGFFDTWSFSSNTSWLDRVIFTDEGGKWSHLEFFDPFTDELVELYPDLPFIELDNPYSLKWIPAYDPTFTRVLYAKCDPECERKLTRAGVQSVWPVVLFDLTENKELAILETTDGWEGVPLWAPDGEYAILMADIHPWEESPPYNVDEFFLFTREGEIHQITHLSEVFTEVILLYPIELSPDGKKVAFWMNTDEQRSPSGGLQYHLSILDLDSKEVTIFCFEPGGYSWAPDSQKLALDIVKPGTIKEHIIIALNLENKTAVKIFDQEGLRGWITSP